MVAVPRAILATVTKIAFLTEMNFSGIVTRQHPNMRTEFSWMNKLQAQHVPIANINRINADYDLIIVIIPKNLQNVMQLIDVEKLKKVSKKIAFCQEGPNWFWQDYPMDQQIWYFNFLLDVDLLFVHNETDKKYFEGLTDKECFVLSSLIIDDLIKDIIPAPQDKVMIGGNMCSWYGGMDSYMIASELELPIYAPSMGRKIENEEWLDNLTHLEYMDWKTWMEELSTYKYGVHLMRTHAAGTFALNTSFWGIPTIGYHGLNTQEQLHPQTTVELGDLKKAKEIAIKLKEDQVFYNECSKETKQLYKEYYSEEAFMKKWKQIEHKILNK